jgi:serine/threonine protein kinase/tetratricopeptide (TPR) repeat protein
LSEPLARLYELADAVCDGTPVDWSHAQSTASSRDQRELLDCLHLVDRIAGVHRSTSWPAADSAFGSSPASLNDTDLTEGPDPEQWGPLRVIQRIGRGTFGDVYRAWDTRLDREVALKLLRPRAASLPSTAALEPTVIAEGRLMARIRHPGVVTVHGAERIDGRAGFWMELVRGQTLEEELAASGPMPAETVARIGQALCSALSAVHAAGLIHRDVKAQNVMRDADGRVVLMDFGIGLELEDQADSPSLAGTPLYVAPEVFEGQPSTVRADLYSVGVLLFHLATGFFPTSGRMLRDIRAAHVRGERRTLREARADFSPAVAKVVDRALSPNPEERFESAAAMERALQGCFSKQERPRWIKYSAAAALFLAAVSILLVAWSASSVAPKAVPFSARDWVLITSFDNRTGESLLDGTLEHALERELSRSSFVNVVPTERVQDTLALMRRPPETLVDAGIGREVAIRDGNIRLLLAGGVEKIGQGYALSARVLRPGDGGIAATVSETAANQNELLSALQRISVRLRQALGETLSAQEAQGAPLERITTPSLEALKLYSRAAATLDRGRDSIEVRKRAAAAEPLLREALRYDPKFAWARMKLAEVLLGLGRPAPDILHEAEQALVAVDDGTAVERLAIAGKYHHLFSLTTSDPVVRSQHLERAAAAYEAVLAVQPDHYEAITGLTIGIYTGVYTLLGREATKAQLYMRLADLRPNSFTLQVRTATQCIRVEDLDKAAIYASRARDRITPEDYERHPAGVAYTMAFPAFQAWAQNDVARALQTAEEMSRALVTVPHAAHQEHAEYLATVLLLLGRLLQAEAVAATIVDPTRRAAGLGKAHAARQDRARLREFYRTPGLRIDDDFWVFSELIDAGLLERARAVAGRLASLDSPRDARVRMYVDGSLAFAEARSDEAIRLLERFMEEYQPGTYWYRAARHIADVRAQKGDLTEGIRVLEAASRTRVQSLLGYWASSEWVRVRDRLAELYRASGRTNDADAVEKELLTILQVADPDHPIKRKLATRVAVTSPAAAAIRAEGRPR